MPIANDDVQTEHSVSETLPETLNTENLTPIADASDVPIIEFEDSRDENQYAEFYDIDSMSPPTRRSSLTLDPDLSEEVPHQRSSQVLDDFVMLLGLWCQDAGITRQQYSGLLEVLALIENKGQVQRLPKSIATLRRNVKASLPLMKMRRKEIPLSVEKLPTFSRAKETTSKSSDAWLYWFDPAHLFSTILSSSQFVAKMHVGMAQYVDIPQQLWHSQSWGSSIRACSGDFARYPNNLPIFPSDIVHYKCARPSPLSCPCAHCGDVFPKPAEFRTWLFPPTIAPYIDDRINNPFLDFLERVQ